MMALRTRLCLNAGVFVVLVSRSSLSLAATMLKTCWSRNERKFFTRNSISMDCRLSYHTGGAPPALAGTGTVIPQTILQEIRKKVYDIHPYPLDHAMPVVFPRLGCQAEA